MPMRMKSSSKKLLIWASLNESCHFGSRAMEARRPDSVTKAADHCCRCLPGLMLTRL